MSLQHVAVGRAAAELSRRGRDVEVHRGDRRGDLTVRRLAAGLLKDETARLLGLDEKKYAKFERSTTAPPAGLVAELQAIDDFITTSAGQLEVTEAAGVSVVVMIDDQAEFERAYPQARTRARRSGLPAARAPSGSCAAGAHARGRRRIGAHRGRRPLRARHAPQTTHSPPGTGVGSG